MKKNYLKIAIALTGFFASISIYADGLENKLNKDAKEWSGIPTVFCACGATNEVAMLDDNLNFGGTFNVGNPGPYEYSLPAGLGVYKGNITVIETFTQRLFTYNPRVTPPAVVGAGDNLGSQPNQIIVDGDYGYVIISGNNIVKVINLAMPSTTYGDQRMVTTIPTRIGSGTESVNPTFGVMHNNKLYVSLTGNTENSDGNQLLEIAVRNINTSLPPSTPQILATRSLTFLSSELETDPETPQNYPNPAGVTSYNGKLYVTIANLGKVNYIPKPVGPGYLAEIDTETWTKTLYVLPDGFRNPRHVIAYNGKIYISCPGLFGAGEPIEGLVVMDAASMEVIQTTKFHRCTPECPTSGPDACFTAAPGRMVIVGDRLAIADEMSGRVYVTDLDGIIPEGMEMGIKVCDAFCYTPTSCYQTMLDIVVIEGRPIITTNNLPNAKIGIEYNQTLVAEGVTPMEWMVITPLPNGLTLSSEGVISGIPTTEGTFNFTVKATNSESSGIKTLTITVVIPIPPEITTEDLPDGIVGEEYSQTLEADGDIPILWTLYDGALPDGLELSPTGTIYGIPTAAGEFYFTVKATNEDGFDIRELSINILNFSGNGTESDPYIITTPTQLAQLATFINYGTEPYANEGVHYKLGNDIDLSEFGENFNDGAGWIPIGIDWDFPFKGVFDGNNKVITNLYINNIQLTLTGLIGNNIGEVKNIGVVDININSIEITGAVVGTNDGNITNCYSTGMISSSEIAGGITGINWGIVSNCYSTSDVTVSGPYSVFAGGIVGENFNSVSNCYTTGNINAFNYDEIFVGGIVGASNNGNITNCYSTSTVISSGYSYIYAGGVAGKGSGIYNCFSISIVKTLSSSSDSYLFVGGIAGVNTNNSVSNCTALNPGLPSENSNGFFGRITGFFSYSSLSNNIAFNYLLNPDGNTNWQNIGINLEDGEDITVDEILADGTLGGRFTEENGWTIENGKLPGFGSPVELPEFLSGGMMVLSLNINPNEVILKKGDTQAFEAKIIGHNINMGTVTWKVEGANEGTTITEDGLLIVASDETEMKFIVTATSLDDNTVSNSVNVTIFDGSGTEPDPYIIYTPEQLAVVAEKTNKGINVFNNGIYKLANNIDLSDYGANFNNGKGWIPIGNINNSFKGVFDGDNNVITNLYINNTTLQNIGLFGYVIGTVKNLGVVDININYVFNNSSSNIGGVAGKNDGNVLNCYSSGLIESSSSYFQPLTGGLIGSNDGSVSKCYSKCFVKSSSIAGGLVGSNNGSVSNCYSTGTVSSFRSSGGIVGYNNGSVSNSYSISPVSSPDTAGGLVAEIRSSIGNVVNCIALNKEIIRNGFFNNYFGRVVGNNVHGYLINNIAFNNMLNPSGNTTWNNKGLNQLDGADISILEINADATLGGRFTEENGWTTLNGTLPGLFGETVEMPEHLRMAPVIVTEKLPDSVIEMEYYQILNAIGTFQITWSLGGALPDGLELSSTGIISGVPTTEGTFNFTVKATNSVGEDTKDLSITVGNVGVETQFIASLQAYFQNNTLYVSGLIPGEKLYIYDTMGRVIMVYDVPRRDGMNTVSTVINIEHLPAGVYLLHINNQTFKIIKQ